MVDLLYWPGDPLDSAGNSRKDSPFWNAIQQVKGDSQMLHIACPYLAPTYIEELIEDVAEWRIVTDVQAWMRVYGGKKEAAIKNFIHTHDEQIRHYPGLHAKAVVGDESAVFGSANLTRNGMVERQEMGVRVTAYEQISDLQEWYEDVWTAGKQIKDGVLPSVGEGVASEPEERTVANAFNRLGKAPSREWANALLNVMMESIRVAQLGEADPRLVTSVAQSDRIVVTVNSRYVCGGFFDGHPRVGFILADEFSGVDEAVQRGLPGEYYRFSTRDGRDPHWVEFDHYPEDALSPEIRPAWVAAIENEVDRGTRSQYRDHHDERVYRLIVDEEYREEVLEELF